MRMQRCILPPNSRSIAVQQISQGTGYGQVDRTPAGVAGKNGPLLIQVFRMQADS